MNRLFLLLCVAFWLGVIAWAAVTYYLSSLSGSQIEQMIPFKFWDKLAHFSLFAAGAVVLATALRLTTNWPWLRIVFLTAMLISLYGATDEWHQQFTPGRSAKDVGDWTADTLGGTAGALCVFMARRWLRAASAWLRIERVAPRKDALPE